MFERIVLINIQVTQYVPANSSFVLKKNQTVTENNLKRETHRQSWNNNFEQYCKPKLQSINYIYIFLQQKVFAILTLKMEMEVEKYVYLLNINVPLCVFNLK